MTEYRWADLAALAAKEGKLGKIVAALCTANQGQPGGGGVVQIDDTAPAKAVAKKKRR